MVDTRRTKFPPAGPPAVIKELRDKLAEYERWFQTMDQQIAVLEVERQRYAALAKCTDAGIVLLNPEGCIAWANDAYRKRFAPAGRDRKDPVGMTCHDGLCRTKGPCDRCPAKQVFRRGKVAHHELNLFIEGKFRPVYMTVTPVFFSDGKVEQVIVMLQDLSNLTVLRQSEDALRSSEERYRSIFEQAGAGMITTRADGSMLQVTPNVCTLLGYTEDELLRKTMNEIVHPEDVSEVIAQSNEVAVGRSPVHEMEYRLVRRDNTATWCRATTVWQLDKHKRPRYGVTMVQDISARKRAQEALARSQKRFEVLVHSIDGIVWESDALASRFTFVSRQAERILGFPVDRWLAGHRFWRNQIHPDDLEYVLGALADVAESRSNRELEYRMMTADGRTIHIRDNVTCVEENQKIARLRGLMIDVTERKKAEEALRISEEQLRQSQKMEAIGRLAGGIAHDFNNLLTAITGYGELLLRGLGEDNPLRREATEISKAAKRAADLTGQLLAFSRQQVLQPKVIDLNEVVRDLESMLRRLIGEHIHFETRLGGDVGAVKADPGQLHQVLLNLVVNARDAMSEGGTLAIETSDVDLDEEQAATLPGLRAGSFVMLAVADTGTGMDEETKARLFEPFFTTKEQGRGTGLGLSTVYGIIRQSDGHISVESRPGIGTTFRILLPRIERDQLEVPCAERVEVPEASPGTERILLVEDDEAVRDLAREVLEMNGYDVVEASNGMQALELFEADPSTIDLVVTDLVMPEMGGRDLAQKLGEQTPGLPILYLSGYTDSAVLQQGMLDPGSTFLQKPFTPAELAHKVREALDD
jgi:PAS domain S-box-containing protein